jgi:hypothetical protein
MSGAILLSCRGGEQKGFSSISMRLFLEARLDSQSFGFSLF